MSKHNRFIWTIKNASRENWYESSIWVLYILVGSLAPVYISILILLIGSQSVSLLDFTRHAQFAIYSSSILATSAYLILRDLKKPFPRRGIFGAIVLVGLITATALFASVTIFSRFELISKFLTVDQNLVKVISLFLFVISIILAFFVNVLDSVIATANVRRLEAEQRAQLETNFDGLGGEHAQ